MLFCAQNMIKEYGIQTVLNIQKLEIHESSRIGLVGRNGAGKTTLLKIIKGELKPDSGVITRNCDMAYIRQASERELAQDKKGCERPVTGRMYSALGLKGSAVKSGGERTRLEIAAAFSNELPLLLADEPTANLDEAGIVRLEALLYGYSGALVLVSHDRELLDKMCTEIWEIDDGKIRVFSGNYSEWWNQRQREQDFALSEYRQYQAERRRLSQAAAQIRQEASKMTRRPRKMSNSEWQLYKGIADCQQNHVQKRNRALLSRLENMEKKEKPKSLPSVSMKLNEMHKMKAKTAVRIDGLNYGYGSLTVFKDFHMEISANQRTFITGPNGCGKSTLLKCIVKRHEGVSIPSEARIGYFSQELDVLNGSGTVLQNVLSAAAVPEPICWAVLKNLYFDDYDLSKKVSVLSGGEKVKTALAMLLVSDSNFLILDEPTNYMDVYTMESFEALLADYEGTLLVVSHDRRFTEKTADKIICLHEK